MKTRQNRYVFIDFETLISIQFEKLEKVADRIYVLINESQGDIPFHLVRQIQALGESLQWLPIATKDDEEINYHLSFVLGQMHETSSPDIKFAVVSNDSSFDPLITYVHTLGRECIRVEHQSDLPSSQPEEDEEEEIPARIELQHSETNANAESAETNGATSGTLIMETARDTIEKLIRSGNRPAELSTLKSYILMNHDDNEEIHLHLDDIIEQLEELQEIEVHEGEVTYNF